MREPGEEQRRRHVVGQVGDDAPGGISQRRGVDLERIAFDDPEPAVGRLGDLGQRRQAAAVALDGDDPPGAGEKEGAGEAARSRPDLDGRAFGESAGRPRDLAGQVEVEKEILAEGLDRLELVAADDLAERRQLFKRCQRWSPPWRWRA